MKFLHSLLIVALTVFMLNHGCSSPDHDLGEDENKIKLLQRLINVKENEQIFIVHPSICGGCTNYLLDSINNLNEKCFLLATDSIDYPNLSKDVEFSIVDGSALGRVGFSTSSPQSVIITDGRCILRFLN